MLQNILDDMMELVYVADIHSYDLLYTNKVGKEAFNVNSDGHIGKCYEILQGRTHPCPFCTNGKLSLDSVYEWDYSNPVTNRHYLLKDKLITWHDGRVVRMEMAVDVTEQIEYSQKIEQMLILERFIVDCVRILYRSELIEVNIYDLLAEIGAFTAADRVYIFTIKENNFSNIYEWCAEGILSQNAYFEKIDIASISRWIDLFCSEQYVFIENVEGLKSLNMAEYELLHKQGIKTLVAFPLFEKNKELIGFIGVDNPGKLFHSQSAELLFGTLAYFIASVFVRQRYERALKELSYIDQFTGLQNRNKFIFDIKNFTVTERENLGICYVDINGLKKINDTRGHEAGDEVIREVGLWLGRHFRKSNIYRIGGDEFVVICPDISKDIFDKKVTDLQKNAQNEGVPPFALGYQWLSVVQNLEMHLNETDKLMYEQKQEYYRSEAGKEPDILKPAVRGLL